MKTSAAEVISRAPRNSSVLAALLSLAILFSGCTSLRTTTRDGISDLTLVVKAGADVTCQLVGNPAGSERFTVTAVEPTVLVVGPRRIPLSEIVWIQVRQVDTVKTLLVVGSTVVVAAVVFVAGGHSKPTNPFIKVP